MGKKGTTASSDRTSATPPIVTTRPTAPVEARGPHTTAEGHQVGSGREVSDPTERGVRQGVDIAHNVGGAVLGIFGMGGLTPYIGQGEEAALDAGFGDNNKGR